MTEPSETVQLSVIVPVCGRHTDAIELHAEYKAALDAFGMDYEVIFVLDGPCPGFEAGLKQLLDDGERFTVVGLTRPFGCATSIMAGFEYASAQTIVTLPAYQQIEASALPRLIEALGHCDMAIAYRWPRVGGRLEQLRRRVFHGLLAWVTRIRFQDLGCGARAFDRRVLEEIKLYGDQHRFLPVLADRKGFRVEQVTLPQSPKDRFHGRYDPREYLRGLLDIFTVFFIVRFTQRPLRFFGALGAATTFLGALGLAWLTVERLFMHRALADRPALLLAALTMMLGLQLFALGLLGELIIFTNSRSLRGYEIERVIQVRKGRPASQQDPQ